MTSNLSILVNQVFEEIKDRRAEGWTDNDSGETVYFENTDFELEKTYYPDRSLQGIPDDGIVYIVGLQPDRDGINRRHERKWMLSVQVAYQIKVKDPHSFDEVDKHIEIHEQLLLGAEDTALTNDLFTWTTTTALKDENGLPFNYAALREASTFEAFATINMIATQKGVSS